MQSIDVARTLLVAPAVFAFVVGTGACTSGDDSEQARTESNPVGGTSSESGGNGTTTIDSESGGDVPLDSDLDIDVRHENGTELTLSHIAFQEDSIVIDLEAYNGGSQPWMLHDASGPDDRQLRLIDDAGNTYNFRPPDEEGDQESDLLLEQGETLSGTWEFLGPLMDHPAQIRLVTMVDVTDIDDVEPGRELGDGEEDDTMTSGCTDAQNICPSFAIPIDLTWD